MVIIENTLTGLIMLSIFLITLSFGIWVIISDYLEKRKPLRITDIKVTFEDEYTQEDYFDKFNDRD